MANMSYCRYENTSKALQDCVDTLMYSDCSEDLSLYESVEWGMDGVEEFENLDSENYNQVHSAIMIATIEKLHLELDTLFSVNDKEPFLPATKSVNDE